jgi:nitrile hydratase beta subunit
MNGIHDMGGMQDMGAIEYAKTEPVFHAAWEARVYAMSSAVGATGKFRLGLRPAIESIPPAEYLRMSYYEKWVAGLVELSVKAGLVTREEVETGSPAEGSPKATPPLTADKVTSTLAKGGPANRDVAVAPRFQVGQRVRARNINPAGHTRLPRYARGKVGTIDRDHSVHVFPDTNAHFLGEKPQHVYSVRFAARELWGEHAARHDAVYIDLWDDHLDPV